MHCNGLFLSIILIIVLLTSCGLNDNPLTSLEKNTVDTLYNNQINEWRNKIDSICNVEKDTLFIRLADSLKQERMEEIELLLMQNHITN